ncbi:hypothetical protein EYF80_033093 [Liparis tanakae]|uniref:Uncharacterized protein n=1 Tax=Liparis tanakae TaxID=230148 RepID=A0A4Z2GT39_9TELE|nr:hypothetical protein EYF80_033093 [Liparis tanakae]
MVSSSSKCLSLISSFFIWVSTSSATRDLIFLSSTAAKREHFLFSGVGLWALTLALVAADARAAAAAVAMFPSPMSCSSFFLFSSPSSTAAFSSFSFSCSEGDVSMDSSFSLSDGGRRRRHLTALAQNHATETSFCPLVLASPASSPSSLSSSRSEPSFFTLSTASVLSLFSADSLGFSASSFSSA